MSDDFLNKGLTPEEIGGMPPVDVSKFQFQPPVIRGVNDGPLADTSVFDVGTLYPTEVNDDNLKNLARKLELIPKVDESEFGMADKAQINYETGEAAQYGRQQQHLREFAADLDTVNVEINMGELTRFTLEVAPLTREELVTRLFVRESDLKDMQFFCESVGADIQRIGSSIKDVGQTNVEGLGN